MLDLYYSRHQVALLLHSHTTTLTSENRLVCLFDMAREWNTQSTFPPVLQNAFLTISSYNQLTIFLLAASTTCTATGG